MYKAILLSIGEPTIIGIYYAQTHESVPKLIFMLKLIGKSSHVLPLLFAPICADMRDNKSSNTTSFWKSNMPYVCNLCECVIDYGFFMENNLFLQDLSKFVKPNSCIKNYALHYYDKYGIYIDFDMNNVEFCALDGTIDFALQLLACLAPLNSIYYARGVGSLSAIKLTHVFLHTLSLSKQIPIYATNSFYFSKSNEIKAFANTSFYLDSDKHILLTDEIALKGIRLAKSSTQSAKLHLPYKLIHNDFLESCTPLYVTPAV